MGTEGKNQQKKETKLKKARVRPPCKTRGNTATRNMLQCTTTREKTAAGTDGGRK